jgi:alpha-1,6-mannosyltransferase
MKRLAHHWHIAGAFSLAMSALLYAWSLRHGTYPVAVWLMAMCGSAAALAWSVWSARGVSSAATPPSAPPSTLPSPKQIIIWAIILRIAALFATPQFEDDYFRYLWDGYRTWVDGNPYRYAPSYFFGADVGASGAAIPSSMAHVLSQINHPDINTIYGPALQWLFAAAAAIAPGELWPIRVMWLLVDIALVVSVVKHAPPHLPAYFAMLYALCPLVLHEVGVAAHPDGLIGALIFWAYLAVKRERFWLMAALIGCAAAMKIHALLALPFLLLGASGFSLLLACRVALACAASYVVFWLPFIFVPGAFTEAWRSFATFARDWQFNALGFSAVQWLVGSFAARIITALLMLAIWAGLLIWQVRQTWQIRRKPGRVATGDTVAFAVILAFATLLLFSPVINAWYILWLLPLATQTRWITPWMAALILPFSYATHFNMGISSIPYTLPTWVMALEWITIFGAFLIDCRHIATPRNTASMIEGKLKMP